MCAKQRFLAILVCGGVLASACGGGGSGPPAASATAAAASAAPPAANETLDADTIAKAKAEGTVVLYTSLAQDDAAYVVDKFSKSTANPGVKVTINRKSSEKLLQQFITEAKAGQVIADVLETGGLDFAQAIKLGYITEFKPPAATTYPAEFKDAAGMWTAGRLGIETIGYNTTLVKAADAPKSFDDAIDPKWKGKLMVEASDVEVMLALGERKYKGDEAKVRDYFSKLVANQPQPQNGHSEGADLLVAGQRALFWGGHGHTLQQKKDAGAPVDYMKGEGVVTIDGITLAKGAPHANAAKVFINWYLSSEGQTAIADRFRVPARPGVKSPAQLPDTRYVSGPTLIDQFSRYQKLWAEVLGFK